MSVKMIFREGLFCPVFVCDTCGEVIKERRLAAAVFDMAGGYPEPTNERYLAVAEHVHKGACLDKAEQRIGPHFGWTELRTHIQFLRENVNDCPRTDREDMP